MRMLWGIICLALLAAPLHARPSPPPPGDFRGHIYVDSTGCVFHRDGRKWTERRVDGQQICGFPPSLDPLRFDVTETAPKSPNMIAVEHDLLGVLASEIRQGELTADKRDREYIAKAPPAPGQGKFTAELMAMMRRDSELQSKLSGSFHANDVCKRLGYSAELDPRPILGWDVTMGLCPDTRATAPRERIAFGQRLKDGLAEHQGDLPENEKPATQSPSEVASDDKAIEVAASTAMQTPSLPANPDLKKITKVQNSAAKTSISKPPGQGVKAKSENSRAAGNQTAEGTRKYVEVGIYRDDQPAEQTIGNLTKMGYPAAQAYRRQDRQTVRIIYAGPFHDSSGLNAALNALRKAGYADAVTR